MRKREISDLIQKVLSKKIIKWGLIPLCLFLLWLSLSLMYSSYRSFTVLQYAQNQDAYNNFGEKRLYKGDKITGEFTAKENNLGIISVRFGLVPLVDYEKEDILTFRIKEKSNKQWLYQNKYRSGGMDSNQFFTFGFPEQLSSKGKKYQFEISSTKGDAYNAIETKNTNPIYLSKYKFSKSEIFNDLSSTSHFIQQKLTTFLTNVDTLLSSIVFLLPLILYFAWVTLLFDVTRKNSGLFTGKRIFAATVFGVIFLDVIFYNVSIPGFMLGLLGLWVYAISINRFKSEITFLLSFALIQLAIVSIYFDLKISVDKAQTFAYLLILIGFVQVLIEYKNSQKK